MADHKLLISGLASTPFLGGGLAGVLLSANSSENNKEIIRTPYKDELLKKGYKISKSYGPSIWILKQYKEFPKDIDNLGDWCKKHETIWEKDNANLRKQFEQFCFETIASEIDNNTEFAILKVGVFEGDMDEQNWISAFGKFQKLFQNNEQTRPSNKWKNTQDIEKFKEQCKENEKVPYLEENKALFEEVKSYCTRKKELKPMDNNLLSK